MKRFLLILILASFFVFPDITEASFLLVKADGSIEWKILAVEDSSLGIPKREDLSVRSTRSGDTNTKITLESKDGDVILDVGEGGMTKTLDIESQNEDIIEIEERGAVKRVKIAVIDGKLAIEQEGIVALSDFPITIDPTKNEISLKTDSGDLYLAILPMEALESALRSRAISRLKDQKAGIAQNTAGVLSYSLKGQKVINLFNIVSYPVDVNTEVSASTGEILFVDQPTWLRILGFLF